MIHKLMMIEATHRNVVTLEPMPQFTRMDMREENGDFIMFWIPSTITFLDEMERERMESYNYRMGLRRAATEA